ncbi:MAG TPA: MlaD family protein [Candidatus Acidoferrales bacterium]|nr:MlaD family protein [Candidatus Acidoferrales bacterium]
MNQTKREQALVGIFVIIAGAILVGTVFALGSISGRQTKTFHSYFPFAGGVEPGTTVRYSGGPKVGRVEKVTIDPKDASRIDVTFSVDADLPVKSDSRVKIMALTPLGDNHVEVLPGTAGAEIAASGTVLPSDAYVDLSTLMAEIQDITPQAQELLKNLNARIVELKETVGRVNDLLSAQNRSNLSAVLADSRGLIQENRPQLKSTLEHLNEVSARLQPVLDDLRKTSAQANQVLDHVDAMIGEDRPDVHQAVLDLRKSLSTVTSLTGRLDQTFDVNSENIDVLLENLRDVTENLKEITDTIKARPYLLIRSSPPPEHKPGGKQ